MSGRKSMYREQATYWGPARRPTALGRRGLVCFQQPDKSFAYIGKRRRIEKERKGLNRGILPETAEAGVQLGLSIYATLILTNDHPQESSLCPRGSMLDWRQASKGVETSGSAFQEDN